ncbi:hypothetical protein FOCC_FOCC006823 [Frankliniella occidentalis]|uniref:Sialic acid synthase n=1 Tax=Frankliniella occidentalis TaxID=133901 RepID=A0A6J1T2R1_FRAOC|nr:sialic acid synthase [Frankliniella occidentalis]KAE8746457.1 hypothetical protein FOCC_FOCC006823 [Frankliniella occidentalis]
MLNPANDIRLNAEKAITATGPCFIIAEIGQNHQGNFNMAKKLIRIAKDCGADCVKFQKSCLPSKFNRRALRRPYPGPNSWGDTYGAHKKYLEFSQEQFKELQDYAEQEVGIMFSASAMDEDSVVMLDHLGVPFIKVGSGDNCNLPLLQRAASTGRPLLVSTGMMNLRDLRKLHEHLTKMRARFALLHCVSSYPAPVEQLNLRVIPELRRIFPDTHIGYSGHELGVEASIAAVAAGARILERHLTLDKTMKGTDHCCSLEPLEMGRMVRTIRHVEAALGRPLKEVQPCEATCWLKLGKCLVAARDLSQGHVLASEDLCVKVADPMGIPSNRFMDVIGKTMRNNRSFDDAILPEDLGMVSQDGDDGDDPIPEPDPDD